MWGMKQLLLIIAVVMGQSVLAADKKPLIADPIVEKEIRRRLKKPKGELTKAELQKLTFFSLHDTQITDSGLKELVKMKQLTDLILVGAKVTSEGQSKLVRALPECDIYY